MTPQQLREAALIAQHHFYGLNRAADDLHFYTPGKVPAKTVLAGFLFPAMFSTGAFFLNPRWTADFAAGVLVFYGVTAAFFFQMSVQWIARSQELLTAEQRPSSGRDAYIVLLHDMGASASFAAFVSLFGAALSGGLLVIPECWATRALFTASVFVAVYLSTTVIRLVMRAFDLTRGNLLRAFEINAEDYPNA
ncbi:hypothetical protein [Candidatus Poriferisodalis sp.]|uniref:hypothetical protein n=1 Tax=Candidatus Poriferisodalis sp. TaxID=3101277 RepID=UPI003B027867